MEMFGNDAGGVLHRHLITGERHHFAAMSDMQRVKRRLP
jgi:hypothetical protein